MSRSKAPLDPYLSQYAGLDFERGGLFACLQETYHPVEVLYPGCSVHLTPAFYFPHVVFVDQDPAAAAFFSNPAAIRAYVRRQRRYRRSPYIQFIAQDFTTPLPLPQNQFDLLLALFTGGVARACKAYLKTGGLLLSNNHHNDAVEAAREGDLECIAVLQLQGGQYRPVAPGTGTPVPEHSEPGGASANFQQTHRGLAYVDQERYYLFRRMRAG